MSVCNNCGSNVGDGARKVPGTVQVLHIDDPQSFTPVVHLCPDCAGPDVKTFKIVLKRNDAGQLCYDSFQPVEATKRAFGK